MNQVTIIPDTNIEAPLTKDILLSIGAEIAEQLTRRGFHAPLSIGVGYRRDQEPYIKLESEPFQTVPVIFKEIRICQFSSTLAQDTSPDAVTARETDSTRDYWSVWIDVHVAYEHFPNGSNGCTLFNFHCSFKAGETLDEYGHADRVRLWNVRIS